MVLFLMLQRKMLNKWMISSNMLRILEEKWTSSYMCAKLFLSCSRVMLDHPVAVEATEVAAVATEEVAVDIAEEAAAATVEAVAAATEVEEVAEATAVVEAVAEATAEEEEVVVVIAVVVEVVADTAGDHTPFQHSPFITECITFTFN
jgi:hypothetical protein